MKNIRLCILDFDGTLGNTVGVILNTLKATFKEMGLEGRTDEEYRSVIGLPLEQCFKKLTSMDDNGSKECAATYRHIFPTFDTDDAVTLFPNVMSTLQTLADRGITLTIASSRGHESLSKYVYRLGLETLTSTLVGADDVEQAKPNPEPVEKILGIFGVKADECMVVGDAPYDILMGRNAGCHTCAVTYGNGTREELIKAGADFVIDDFADLLTVCG